LIGLAFGKDAKELGIGTEIVDARSALAKIGLDVPPSDKSATPPRRKKAEGLPMPRMPEDEEVTA
jgi:hypothetical protein